MPSHNEKYHSPHSQQQLFDIVADVQSYPEFLPWVVGCRIDNSTKHQLIAELIIKFKAFRGGYTSRVILNPPTDENEMASIDVELVKGPFKSLTNNWKFFAYKDGSTEIDFHLDFEFKSKILSKMLTPIFSATVKHMVQAFEQRAEEIYGNES